MATLEQIGAALQRADAAGNVEDARALAAAYKQMKAQGAPAPVAPGPAPLAAGAPPQEIPLPDPMRADIPANQPAGEDYRKSYVGQGMSGVNEGMAKALGAPVDLINEWGIKPALAGINAVAGTDLKASETPFGGSRMVADVMAPTIFEGTDDPAKQITRRIGQDVGAMLPIGLPAAAASATPLKTLGAELLSSFGSGAGAATAEQVAPGNPVAEIAGSLLGGFSPMALAAVTRRLASKTAAPTVEALQNLKNVTYKQADALGVKYTPQAFGTMVSDIDKAAAADRFNPIRHEKTAAMLGDFKKLVADGYSPSLTELDQLRQVVRRDVANSPDPAEAHFGDLIIDGIDDFIGKAGGAQVSSGNPAQAAATIAAARELNTRWRKSELLAEAFVKARRQVASTGSGGNINNAYRQAVRAILDNPKKSRAFTDDERALMESLVKQGKFEDILRLVGKLSPGGNGLMAALGIGGTAINPMMAAVPVAGIAAKAAADVGTAGKVAALQQTVQRGGPAVVGPVLSGADKAAAATVPAVAAANQNNPAGSLVTWLQRSGFDDLAQAVAAGKLSPRDAYDAARARQRGPAEVTVNEGSTAAQ